MKIIVKQSELTKSQLNPELEITNTSLKEQLIPTDSKLKLPSSFEVCEFSDPWDLTKDLRFFHHLELNCQIKIKKLEVLIVVHIQPLLTALELAEDEPSDEYFETTIGTLKKAVNEDTIRRFNAEETSTRHFEFKITFRNIQILSEGTILKPRIWGDDNIKFYDHSFGNPLPPTNQQGIRRSSNTPRIYTQQDENRPPPRMTPPRRHIRRSSRESNLGESFVQRNRPRSPSPPRRDRSPSPRHSSPRHHHERTAPRHSPIRHRTPSPRQPNSSRRRSPSPPRRRSPSPPRRRSPSPSRQRNPSPPRQRSSSPPMRRNPSHHNRSSHSRSRNSALPRLRSPSPTGRRGPSYQRRTSPFRRSPSSPRRCSRSPQRQRSTHQHTPPPSYHTSPPRNHSLRRSPPPPATSRNGSSSNSSSTSSSSRTPGQHTATTSVVGSSARPPSPNRSSTQNSNANDARTGHRSNVLDSVRSMRSARSGVFSASKEPAPGGNSRPETSKSINRSPSSSPSPLDRNWRTNRPSRTNPAPKTASNAAAESEQTIDQARNIHHQVSGINAQYKELQKKATAPEEHETVYHTTVEPGTRTATTLGETMTIPTIVTFPSSQTHQLPSTVSSTRSHLSPSMNEIEINESGIQRLNISEAPAIPPPPPPSNGSEAPAALPPLPARTQLEAGQGTDQLMSTAEKDTNTSMTDIDLANDSLTAKVINRSRQGRTNPFASTDSDTDENEVYLHDNANPLDERLEGVIKLLEGREDDVRHGLGMASDWFANYIYGIDKIKGQELNVRLDNLAKLLVMITVIISRKENLSPSTVERSAVLGKRIFNIWSQYEAASGRVYTREKRNNYNQNLEAFSNVGWDHPSKTNDTPDTLKANDTKSS